MFVSLPFKEIIFGLRGYSGDFFVLDELEFENNLDKKLFDDSFGEANLESLKRLCALAVQHKILLDYVQSVQGRTRFNGSVNFSLSLIANIHLFRHLLQLRAKVCGRHQQQSERVLP